jgi:hypothetical protein
MDQTYIKAATRLRDKIASPLSPSPIFFSGISVNGDAQGSL